MKTQILLQDNQLINVTEYHFKGELKEIAAQMKSIKPTDVTYRLIVIDQDGNEESVLGVYLGYCQGFHWWRNDEFDHLYCTEYNEDTAIDSPQQTFRNIVHVFPIRTKKVTKWHEPV